MNKLILGIITGVVLAGALVTTILYHDLYKQEQVKVAKAEEQIIKLTDLVEANKKNTETELNNSAANFIEYLFRADEEADPAIKTKTLLSLTTGKAHTELSETEEHEHEDDTEHTGDLEGFKSEAQIQDSVYNRLSETKGKVVIEFEHLLTKDGNTSKTVNQATIKLQYVKGEWKVYEYDIKPLL